MDQLKTYVVNRAGELRETTITNGRVDGWNYGQDLFQSQDKTAIEARQKDILAVKAGKVVMRGE